MQREFEAKLKKFMIDNKINAEYLSFEQSCHSVAEAALAANASEEDFVKNICMVDNSGNLIVAIVNGEDRASTSQVAKVLGIERPRTATPEEILEKIGYPCGGVPSFGYSAIFLIDEKVMQKPLVYSSGGSENSLIKITPTELLDANKGKVAKIRQ